MGNFGLNYLNAKEKAADKKSSISYHIFFIMTLKGDIYTIVMQVLVVLLVGSTPHRQAH